MEAFAQVDGGVVEGLRLAACAHRSRALPERPHLKQWKIWSSRLAEKQRLVPEVRAVQGAGSALLGAAGAVGLEAEQLQDGGHGDGGADGGEVDGGPRSDWPWARMLARCWAWRSCLRRSRASASLRSRASKISCVAAFELVLGRDVADGAVQADGVVMGDVIERRCGGHRRATAAPGRGCSRP